MTEDLDRQKELFAKLHELVDRPIRLMVVCGTQNRAILRAGIREQLPEDLELVTGPGCSACVMPAGHIDAFVKIGMQPKVITAACEDLLRIPGSKDTLGSIRGKGARVEIITSPMDALDLAKREPDFTVVYPAVGFEATAPAVAETILEAAKLGVENFCVVPSIRLLPPTIDHLMLDPDLNIRGLLCSDHVNTISDNQAYTELAKKHKLSCYIGGFEVVDILEGLVSLVTQIRNNETEFDDTSAFIYSSDENKKARRMVSEVFFTTDTDWRGLGTIERSGFVIRDELSLYDATKRFNVRFKEGQESCMCQCNAIISGRGLPPDCPAFGMVCTPESPIGPCMISDEGICHSYFKYNVQETRNT
ncbi:hydrogenase formation protein HypD [Desulforhopalus singaporensis]|uniref:Hydrogenase expression/formation protein HypD n=1 Tax=Desulforhopalus singaporensis TaxID=91360 RepID=A0A1H0K240_9BACT|nr:hydrogenase formation protein HypD [Desulforhopalus singaporensis]SDO50085.1 hydrogenase expression/formation protein HypD [Desulforhopalus singaporensis]